jgi:hypothetical protein
MTPIPVEKRGVRAPSIADIWAVPRAVWGARHALDRGDLALARELVRPLVETYSSVTFVRKLAAEVLYASGDPLSAAVLFERSAKKLRHDRAIAVGLVASYAALNRPGDARRSAEMLAQDVDVRLALAWAELAANGGDRDRGAAIVRELAADPDLGSSRERRAMHAALQAIVAARAGDGETLGKELDRTERERLRLAHPDSAFLGYLIGIALRDAHLADDATAAFTRAIEESPDSIGAALARRERANAGPPR